MFAMHRAPPERQPQLDALIETATRKIGTCLVYGATRAELHDSEMRFATSAMLMYGEHAKRFAFGPNHAACGEFETPRGFQFNVAAEAPLYATPFPERGMFNGVMAFPLERGARCNELASSKRAIPSGYFGQKAVRQSIQKLVNEDKHLGDDDTNYAGIFSTTVRDGFENRLQYWAVVQCHSTEVSEQFYAYLCDKEACHGDVLRGSKGSDYTTWNEFFLKDERVAQFAAKQREHRAKVLCTLIRACGLGPVSESKSLADNVEFLLESPHTIHVTFNTVEQLDADSLAFLSDSVSYKSITSAGTILREPARLGLALLRGPWATPRHPLDAGFPCSTGHRTAIRLLDLESLSESERGAMRQNETHFWEHASRRPFNTNLATTEANTRDDRRWKKIESLLGFDRTSGMIDLRPVQVKLHSTEQPSVGAHNSRDEDEAR